LYIQMRNENATGAITTSEAIRIEAPLKTGAITTSYSINQIDAADINYFGGLVGIGVTGPTARLHLMAGTASANSAPLKFNSGTLLTTKEAGAVGYNNDFYHTRAGGTVRFGLGGCIFDHFADAGNTTTTETDLYSDTIPASTLDANGVKLSAEYGGTFVSSATATRQVKVYFAGTVIFDSGALTVSAAASWNLDVLIVRVSSTVVRYTIIFLSGGLSSLTPPSTGELTGLTLSNSAVLKITGQSAGTGAATNDIVAKAGTGCILAPAA